jgi:hypothetical protein
VGLNKRPIQVQIDQTGKNSRKIALAGIVENLKISYHLKGFLSGDFHRKNGALTVPRTAQNRHKFFLG